MSLYQARRPAIHLAAVFIAAACTLVARPAAAAGREVRGVIVDQSGRALPRAYITDAADTVGVFADQGGRFTLVVSDVAPCQLNVRLSGFAPQRLDCGPSDVPVRIQLRIAPIEDAIIVSATRTDAPAGQVGASATVFSERDLERRQTPLVADLLQATPGAMVVRNGGPGALAALFVRGGESDYNKVLIDGIPLNEPGGAFYLNNLTTENIERIEVVRGAYSSLFGSDAMASVIQLFTKRAAPGSRPRAVVQLDGGTYDTVHGSAGVTGRAAWLDYSLAAARFQSDNRVPNSRLENTTLSGNVGLALAGSATLRLVARGELEDVGTPGPTAFGRPDLDAFFKRHDGVIGLTYDQQLTPALRQRVSYSVALSNQQSTNLLADPPFVAAYQGRTAQWESGDFTNDSRSLFRRHHASYQSDWRIAARARFGDQLLTLLADWDGERATLKDRLAATETRHTRDNVGASIQHQVLWRRVFLTAGGRVERNESFGVAFVPRAAIVLVARERGGALGETRLKFSAGTGIKEPTMLESFSTSPYFRGNPGLAPERSRSVEFGLEQRFADDRAKLDIAWFDNRFRDIISLRTDFATFEGQYFNVGVTRARGLEVGATLAPVAAVRARAAYTLLDSEIVDSTVPENPLFAVGAWAFRRPRHSGSVGATVLWGPATVDVNGVFVGRFVDSDFGLFNPPLVESPGHTSWDVRGFVRISSRLTTLVTVDNLTNADYSEPFGYQPLRRVVRAGVRVSF